VDQHTASNYEALISKESNRTRDKKVVTRSEVDWWNLSVVSLSQENASS